MNKVKEKIQNIDQNRCSLANKITEMSLAVEAEKDEGIVSCKYNSAVYWGDGIYKE